MQDEDVCKFNIAMVSNAIFHSIVEHTVNGIIVTDRQGNVVWVNSAFATITGYELSEIRGLKPGDFLQGPDTDPKTISYISEKLKLKSQFAVDILNYKKSGQAYWINVRCEPYSVSIDNEVFDGFIAIQRNVDQKVKEAIELNENEAFNQALLSAMQETMIITNMAGEIHKANLAIEKMFGYTKDSLLGLHISALLDNTATNDEQIRGSNMDVFGKRADGSQFPVSVNTIHTQLRSKKLTLYMVYDLTERRAAEASLLEFKSTLDSTLDCVFMFYSDTLKFFYVNQGAVKQLGYSKDELYTMAPFMIKPQLSEAEFRKMIKVLLEKKQASLNFETIHRRKDGTDVPVEIFLQYVELDNSRARFIAIVRDITEQLQQNEKIEYLAYYDSLTNLPNRRFVIDELTKVIQTVGHTREYAAVILIDMDDFKVINDTLGHLKGDEVLVEMTKRFQTCLPANSLLARLGGDEFLVVMESLSEDVEQAKQKINTFVDELIEVSKLASKILERQTTMSSSIGIVIFNDSNQPTSELVRRADIAMYDAKSKGKNTFSFYDQSMHKQLMSEQALLAELRVALESDDQLVCWYQPLVNASKNITGYEALVRWQHPEKGLLTPFYFIELAENNGLICQLGEIVLNQACQAMACWINRFGASEHSMSVNISQQQLALEEFPNIISNALNKAGLAPKHLRLEITETELAVDIVKNIESMQRLQKLGVSFSLDDFGTGYSSLSYLQKLPIKEVKIDRSFVHDLLHDKQVYAIVRSVVRLAQELDLSLVCEGIEEEEQWKALREMGCNIFQGYFFALPQPAASIDEMLVKIISCNNPISS